MSDTMTSGKCRLCGELFAKARMSTHLKQCAKRATATLQVAKPAPCFHVFVEAKFEPWYWLHLEVPATATFGALDQVLRDIWLECCGHMSAFTFPRERLPRPTLGNFNEFLAAQLQRTLEGGFDDEDDLMDELVGTQLKPAVKFGYEYDFGTTTELSLRVVAERPRAFPKSGIHLLARNEPPEILCVNCKKPATQICPECAYEGAGALCKTCAKKHDCGDEMLLPVLNTPRTGVCGYTGPSKEPK